MLIAKDYSQKLRAYQETSAIDVVRFSVSAAGASRAVAFSEAVSHGEHEEDGG